MKFLRYTGTVCTLTFLCQVTFANPAPDRGPRLLVASFLPSLRPSVHLAQDSPRPPPPSLPSLALKGVARILFAQCHTADRQTDRPSVPYCKRKFISPAQTLAIIYFICAFFSDGALETAVHHFWWRIGRTMGSRLIDAREDRS